MMSLEKLFLKIISGRSAITKIVMFGVLTFVPVIFFLSFGYLWQYIKQCSRGEYELPEWDSDIFRIKILVKDGVFFFLLLLIFYIAPIVIAFYVAEVFFGLMKAIRLAQTAYFAYVLVSAVMLVAPYILAYAVLIFLKKGEDFSIFLKPETYSGLSVNGMYSMILPSLAFNGLIILGSPLYGISFFLGLTILIPYFQLMSSEITTETV